MNLYELTETLAETQAELDSEREAHTETELALERERERVDTLRDALTVIRINSRNIGPDPAWKMKMIHRSATHALAETEPETKPAPDPAADAAERLMEDFDRAINKLKDA